MYACAHARTQKIDKIYRENPEEGHTALKEFPLKLGAAIQQLISGIAIDPILQNKVRIEACLVKVFTKKNVAFQH
jgi:hypothetical protein